MKKPYSSMTTAELAKATEEFDKEEPGKGLPGKPLTAAQKLLHARARRGRPVVGEGAKIVPISIEQGLLRQADAFAKARHLKRSELVAWGLRLLINTGPS